MPCIPAYIIERSVIVHNRTDTKIWSIKQIRTFDYRTIDSRTQLNVRLQDSCLFNFYINKLTLIKNEVIKILNKVTEYYPIIVYILRKFCTMNISQIPSGESFVSDLIGRLPHLHSTL